MNKSIPSGSKEVSCAANLTVEGAPPATPVRPPPTTPREPKQHPGLVNCADIEAEEVIWLWKYFIPRGSFTIVEGDADVGKSWFCLAVAALLSQEGLRTLYICNEDPKKQTIAPRLNILGAIKSHISCFSDVPERGRLTLGTSMLANRELLDLIRLSRADLVIVSPLDGFLGPGISMNQAESMRPLGDALNLIAEKVGCGLVIVRHLAKRLETRSPLHAGLGSVTIAAAARSVIQVAHHPDFELPDDRAIFRSIIVHSKNNLGPREKSLSFELRPFENVFRWTDTRNVEAEEILMGPSLRLMTEDRGEAHQAGEQLRQVLAGTPGLWQVQIMETMERLGYSKRTTQRAAARLGIERQIVKDGRGRVTGSIWRLPAEQLPKSKK